MSQLIELSQIPTLAHLYETKRLTPSPTPRANASSRYNNKISLIRYDITQLRTSAIVNAANQSLLGGGGVDGAIHSAAGPKLYDECKKLNGCDTGDAKITNAYELPGEKVIHAVGPIYRAEKRHGTHAQKLQSCYTRSLDLVVQHGCKSVAFSALSTGAYGYPSEEAAETVIEAVKGWLDEDEERSGKIERIVFCSFELKDERAYEKFIPQFFSCDAEIPRTKDSESDNQESKTGNSETPKLPDVPTNEPMEAGQPDVKRRKVESEGNTEGAKTE